MPLTSRPGEMSGNIPLILVASEDEGAPYYHPRARQGYTADFAQPCIISSDLGSFASRYRCAIWLPTPTLVGYKERRRLLVAYEVRLNTQNTTVKCPQFQVMAMAVPSRPGAVATWSAQTSYTEKNGVSTSLSTLTADGPTGHGETVIEIRNIEAPGDDPAVQADCACYLDVYMPCDYGSNNVTSLVFRLLGVAVDQW
jgi:hypothetical protein